MKYFKIVKQLDKKKWSDFVYNHPEGNIFQTSEMFEVYKNTKNWQPMFFAALGDNENVSGLVLAVTQKELGRFLGRFSSRAVIWGGPLITPDLQRKTVMKCLLEAVTKALEGKVIFVQFRNLFNLLPDKKEFIANGYQAEEHLNFLANLEKGENFLWNNLESSKRRAIKKAINEKLEIKTLEDPSQIQESYAVLQLFYKRIGVPLPDKSFFESIFRILYPKNMVKIFLAYHMGKVIGVLYLFTYRERVTISYTTSLFEYQNKRPNDFLYWEAIKWSSANGYRVFDFGGAGNPHKEYGVREFKKHFGGEMVDYGRFTKIYQPSLMRCIDLAIRIRKKI